MPHGQPAPSCATLKGTRWTLRLRSLPAGTTLERYVRALGGRMEVRAVFDGEAVDLTAESE